MLTHFVGHKLRLDVLNSVATGFLAQAILIVSGILAARILSVESRGYLALLIIFPSILTLLGSAGLPQAVTHYIAKYNSSSGILLKIRRVFILQICLVFLLHAVLLVLYLQNQAHSVVVSGCLTLIATPALLCQIYGLSVLQGLGNFKSLNLLRLFLPALYAAGLLILFLTNNGNLISIALVWTIACMLSGVLSLLLALSAVRIHATVNNAPIPNIREMLGFGMKGLLGSVTPIETFKIDQLIAGLILSPNALGLYVVGHAFTSLPRFVAQSAAMIAYPTISKNKDTKKLAWKLTWNFMWVITGINTILSIIIILAIPYLLPLFFGEKFSESVILAQILMIGALLISSRRILVEALRGLGYPLVSTISEVVMYPILIIIGVYLLNKYAVFGLALSISIGYAVAFSVSLITAYVYWVKWSAKKDKLVE